MLVLTKADRTPDVAHFADSACALQSGLRVEPVDGRDPTSVARLADCCALGETVALVGSSGVGKSTLINTLRGSDALATQPVREDDGKGRHTTTVREMHRIVGGAAGGSWLIDTPGIRELQMSEVASGVTEVFDDVTAIARECRFANCTHGDEPECAIRAAIAAGALDPARVLRWRKLAEEDAGSGRAPTTRHQRRGRRGERR